MAATDPARSPDKRLLGYRFAGVALDLRRQTLSVDGEDVASTPLMLRLLQLLCEADGHLLKRQDVFDRLWPGGQEVSDSALSQLVWRLRGALGPYADLLATVRRSGLRLDAPVTAEFDFQRRPPPGDGEPPRVAQAVVAARPVPAGRAAEPATTAVAPPRPDRRLRLLACAAALVAVAVAGWLLWPRNPPVNAGYALYAEDLQAGRSDTAALATSAFAAANSGDRARATALMSSLHASDPSTPVPALMLAWWASDAPGGDARPWLAAARSRLRADSSPYLRLLVDYFDARSTGQPIHGPLKALLDLRPQAWYLQYSLAHEQLARRELAGALHSLQQIPLDLPVTRDVAAILADRVSLGDGAAEAAALRLDDVDGDPVRAQLRGRIAYSHGRLAEAIAELDRCRSTAATLSVYEPLHSCSVLGTLASIEANAADAASRVEATVRLCHELGRRTCRLEMSGFEIFLTARSAQPARAEAALARLWQDDLPDWMRPSLALLALENGLPSPADVEGLAAALPASPVYGGVAELLLAWQAQARGDVTAAQRQLAFARERGVARTYHAEDAALLAARLGEAQAPCRVDPPYPNVLRLSACIALSEASSAAKSAATP